MRQTFIITFKDGEVEEHCFGPWKLLRQYLEDRGVLKSLEPVLPTLSRVWTEIMTTPDGKSQCMGFATLAQVWDVANFHCEDERSRARLIARIETVIEEAQNKRAVALVYIHADSEKDWKPLLEKMGAKPASRWLVPAGASFEEGGAVLDV